MRIVKNVDLTWVSQGRFSTQHPKPTIYLSGLDVNVNVGRHLALTPSYYYLAFKGQNGQKGHFQVPL